jgi:hypothetical protein
VAEQQRKREGRERDGRRELGGLDPHRNAQQPARIDELQEQTDDQLRQGDPQQLSLACWSLVHGLSALLINGAIPAPVGAAAERRLIEGVVRLLGEGLNAANQPRSPSRH